MNQIVKAFLQDRFTSDVGELFDDPSYTHEDFPYHGQGKTFQEWVEAYVLSAKFLDLDFWKLAEREDVTGETEREHFKELLREHGMPWGWTPEEKLEIEPEVADDENEIDLKNWCYRFLDEKGTHYGPVRFPSVPRLLEHLRQQYGSPRINAGVEFWLTDQSRYLDPPEDWPNTTIYRFTKENGWKPFKRT